MSKLVVTVLLAGLVLVVLVVAREPGGRSIPERVICPGGESCY